jgi:hypothetical protein
MLHLRRLAALATIFVAACASTEAPDLTPDVDPNLPGIHGGGDPSRADGGEKVPGKNDSHDVQPTSDGGNDSGPTTTSAPTPTQGEVLITELMYDSSGPEPDGEWFELYNTASSTRSLGGLTLVDGGNRTHTIQSGTTIGAGEYVVFVRNRSMATAEKVPGASSAYEYGGGLSATSGIVLANGTTGSLALKDGTTIIAQADYGGWFTSSSGTSIQMKTLSYASGASKTSWCQSPNTWSGSTDKGTPGQPSDCP